MEYGFWDVVKLLGSLGIFIFGMKMMSDGIQKIAGSKLKSFLNTVTRNRFFGVLAGFGVTSVVQSSSSSTVMLVSFVNAGLVSVRQAISVIMGANIGTTVTAWIIALIGFKLKMVDYVAMPMIVIGVPMMFSTIRKRKSAGEFLVGFSLLFLGLNMLKHAVPDLKHDLEAKAAVVDQLQSLADTGIGSILMFVLIGTVVTVIVQSSSAAMGITLALVSEGWVPFEVAAAMILGENIGTTITANLAAIVGNVNAKRAAFAHLVFNVFGVVWMLIFFSLFIQLVDYMNLNWFSAPVSLYHPIPPDGSSQALIDEALAQRGLAMTFGLAIFHTSFNIFNTLILIWFVPFIETVVNKVVVDKKRNRDGGKFLGRAIVDTPELVIMEARKEIVELSEIAIKTYDQAASLIDEETPKRSKLINKIAKNEAKTDEIELEVSGYLVEASQSDLSPKLSNEIIGLIGVASDLESIADVSYQISVLVEEKDSEELVFKNKMKAGLDDLLSITKESLDMMHNSLTETNKLGTTERANELYNKSITLRDSLRSDHLKRLGNKEDSIQLGIIYRDLVARVARVAELSFYINKQISSVDNQD